MSGWSNFCTLVGHFSKLFEFAGLSRLKTPIFVPNSRCSPKKKKKGLQLKSISKIPIFVPNSGCSLKKKKGLQLESIYEVLFRPKIIAFLKKKVAAACTKLFRGPHAARGPVVGPRWSMSFGSVFFLKLYSNSIFLNNFNRIKRGY